MKLSPEDVVVSESMVPAVDLDKLLIGQSAAMRSLKESLAIIGASDVSVLISGPTGAGKEVVANALHLLSGRTGAMVPVNCGAIPRDLLESELFGHEKGAYTGAHSRHIGLIERANGGTLFLDEVGEMSEQVQVKLLRALENRTIYRVGSSTPISVDFRLLSATNRNLHDEVAQNRFREDFLFRIEVFSLQVPALRDHAEDIPLLLEAMAQNTSNAFRLNFSDGAKKILSQYEWPGNIRELRNFFSRAQILFGAHSIGENDICAILTPSLNCLTEDCCGQRAELNKSAEVQDLRQILLEKGTIDFRSTMNGVERKMIQTALELSEGCVTQAANMLQVK